MDLCLGIYLWELIVTFEFDWSIITGRRKFIWTMALWFLCRYSLLVVLVSLAAVPYLNAKDDCSAFYIIVQACVELVIVTSTSLLMLRTIAIWGRRPAVYIPLLFLLLGQVVICLLDVCTLVTYWDPVIGGCIMTHSVSSTTPLVYVYTIVLNAIVLALTTAGLLTHLRTRSKIVTMLFTDGLVYFIVATLSSLVPTIFIFLNLNEIFNYMFVVPATTASTIVATRVVVRLIRESSNPTIVFGSSPAQHPAHIDHFDLESRITTATHATTESQRVSRNVSTLPTTTETLGISLPETGSGSRSDLDHKEGSL